VDSRVVGVFRVCLVLAGCIAIGAIAGCGSSGGSSGATESESSAGGTPIKIGVISTDHFKPQEIDSNDVPETAKRWQAYVNAHGGINGHPVSVTEIDDRGNPASGLQALEELKNDGVVAIADNSVNDHVDDAAFPGIADAAHIPMIGLSSQWSAKVYEKDPNFFATGSTESNEIWMPLESASLAGKKKWGMLCRGPAVACKQYAHLFDAEGRKIGLSMVYDDTIALAATHTTAQCRAAESAGAEALFIASPSGEDANLVADDCGALGYHPTLMLNGTTIRPYDAPDKAITAAVNNQTMPYFVRNKDTAAFHEAMDGYLPSATSGFDVMTTWVGLQVIAEAAKAGVKEGGKPTADDIYEGLYSFKGNTIGGLAGPLTYVKGKPSPSHCGFFFALQKGKYSTPWGTAAMCS
jgi:branched-chain amino acid transport system substrate-binding protein